MADARHRTTLRLVARAGRVVRGEDGFGFIELVIALTILNVGILAVVAGFSSGYAAINRSTSVSSATVLADAQMERFRALRYTGICLSTTSTGARYVANKPEGTAVATCVTTDPALVAVRDPVTGPDGASYRIDTYIVWKCITGTLNVSSPYSASSPGCTTSGLQVAAPLKLLRIAVRDHTTLDRIYAHEESSFDQSSGL